MRREVDGAALGVVDHERVAVQFGQPRREHRPQERPQRGAQRLVAAGQRLVELAAHALAAEHLGARDAVGVEHERGGAARDERGDAAQRVGLVERALQFGVDDRVDGHRLVPAALADGPLAFGVGPAGAVGDHVAVVAGEQVADDRAQRVELGGGGVDQSGAQVVAEAEVGAHGLGARCCCSLLVLVPLGVTSPPRPC